MKILLVLLTAATLAASDNRPLTGQFYRDLPEAWRVLFATGFVTGYAKGQVSGSGIAKCLYAFSNGQTSAILDKYVADHPERW